MALTWQDTLSDPAGSPPDFTWWTAYTNGVGNGNSELEYYLPAEAVQNGTGLALTAHRSTVYQAQYPASQFTSGKVSTKGKVEWRYGHLIVEATIPCGGQPGAWPAIWMLGAGDSFTTWPASGEIDVMESFGSKPSAMSVSGSLHTGQDWTAAVTLSSPVTETHKYELIWRPDSLHWAVDGTTYLTVLRSQMANWVFDQPCYLILNLAIGGTMGGAVPAAAVMPYEMVVNSVSLYDAELITGNPAS
jgi:beta-glucanase (GH16 family)